MNPADSQIVRNCSSGSSILNRYRWSRQRLPLSSFGLYQETNFLRIQLFRSLIIHFWNGFLHSRRCLTRHLFSYSDHTNSILLRRYWADLPSELCEVKVHCLLIPLWNELYFFHCFSSRFLVWAHLYHGIWDYHFLQKCSEVIWSASLSHFPSGFWEYVPYHFSSLPPCPRWTLFA